jgi:hypothetical protein
LHLHKTTQKIKNKRASLMLLKQIIIHFIYDVFSV